MQLQRCLASFNSFEVWQKLTGVCELHLHAYTRCFSRLRWVLGLRGRCGRQTGAPGAEQHGWHAGPGHTLALLGLRGRCAWQVAHRVQGEFPSVQTLATLSPLPGFRPWLLRQLQAQPDAVRVPFPCQPVRLCMT